MHPISPLAALPLAACLLLHPAASLAGEGHDHGDAAPAAASTAGAPRFATQGAQFELVGVLQGHDLSLYLDRAADNSPVTEARIELDIAGQTLLATRHEPDSFEVELPDAPAPGLLKLRARVSVGEHTEVMDAELDLHGEAAHDAAGATQAGHRRWALAAWGLAALAGLGLLTQALRRARSTRALRQGGAA